MTTTQTPPAALDRDLLQGVPARVEEILPENPERLERALALQTACRQYDATIARLTRAADRVDELTEQIRSASDAQRNKLSAERQQLAADLVHGPNEAEAAAKEFADALIAWAPSVARFARQLARKAYAEGVETRTEIARLNRKVEPGLPAHSRLSKKDAEEVWGRIRELGEQNRPARERVGELEALADSAAYLLKSRFGEHTGGEGRIYSPSGVGRWVEAHRSRIAKRSRSWSGISEALRPRSRS